MPELTSRRLRQIIVIALCLFLIVYHIAKIWNVYAAPGTVTTLIHIQTGLRVLVIGSLGLMIAQQRYAIWLVWAAVGALVASQLYALGFDVGLLRGLIIPAVLTALCWPRR